MSEVLMLRNYGARDIEKGDVCAVTKRGVRWLERVPARAFGIAAEAIPRGAKGPVILRGLAFLSQVEPE